MAQREALLKALGMVPPDLDLYALSLGLLNEGFDQGQGDSAVYDLETNEFYVAEDLAELKPGDEFQIAAEYARALLYQHFDLDRLTEQSAPDSEATRALEILILADTAFAGQRYMAKHISPDRLIGLSSGPEQPVFDSAPRFVQREAFAAQAGINFISALSESGGTAAMGLVYANPPISTEQIYHPDKYLGGEAPVEVTLPDLPTALGPQWDEIFGGVMGESFLRGYLAELDEAAYEEAAAGWGGDRFSLLEGPLGETALAVLIVWDTATDAREFFDVVGAGPGASDAAYVGLSGDRVLLVIGPDETVKTEIRQQFPGF